MDIGNDPRLVSRLTRHALALVLAGGRGSRLEELTRWRAKPAVHFGGKFRIIDFVLSNCVNSGIRRIGVLTQYKAHSLISHLVRGWSRLHSEFGDFLEILPASQRTSSGWYAGTADALYQNLDIIRTFGPDFVFVLAGDHIYKMDYGRMLLFHQERGADMTVGCVQVSLEEARGFGVMAVDASGRVQGFEEKSPAPRAMPGAPERALASMGIYVLNTEFLYDELIRDARNPDSDHDFGKSIIPDLIGRAAVYAYPFTDPVSGRQAFWRDVGTVDAYWAANMELVGPSPELDLYDLQWPVRTYQPQLPSAKFLLDDEERCGVVVNSVVSGGCVISSARLRRSLLFSNVKASPGSVIDDSVVLPEVEVGRGCRIRKAVIDRGCQLPEGLVVGEDPERDARRFRLTPGGVTLVTPDMLGQRLHAVE
ncbi:MAG: glucose-1-phosphate adenylyltransferase [Gammaproteobacteria bacterium]|nr:glucose-1-phosphate adenylyltransferase [Gammaproteobacteria bacterium]